MNNINKILLLLVCIIPISISTSFANETCTHTPESIGNIKLVDSVRAFPEYAQAVSVIIQTIKEGGENPRDFYVEIEKDKTRLIFHLWHISAFSKENCNMDGNPGGLCRDVVYDLQTKKVTEKGIWQ